jgi:bifunctional non-homologous end joining protein LigD
MEVYRPTRLFPVKPSTPSTPRLLYGLQPMLLDDRRCLPFNSPDWVFEVKNDGYRVLAEFGAGQAALRTRGGHDCSEWFPEVTRALGRYRGGPHVVDGEVCVLDELGRSDFDRLQQRAYGRRYYPGCDAVTYCMFDLLIESGVTLMDAPLLERKARLKKLFTPKPKHHLLVVDAIPEAGIELYGMAVELKLEGLVAKKADSIYLPGERTREWRKVKVPGAVPPERFRRS